MYTYMRIIHVGIFMKYERGHSCKHYIRGIIKHIYVNRAHEQRNDIKKWNNILNILSIYIIHIIYI